jgi:hypothetical protein
MGVGKVTECKAGVAAYMAAYGGFIAGKVCGCMHGEMGFNGTLIGKGVLSYNGGKGKQMVLIWR